MGFWEKFDLYNENKIHYAELPSKVHWVIENSSKYKEIIEGPLTIREYNKNLLIILDDDERCSSLVYFRKLDEKGYELCKVIARIPSNVEKKLRG